MLRLSSRGISDLLDDASTRHVQMLDITTVMTLVTVLGLAYPQSLQAAAFNNPLRPTYEKAQEFECSMQAPSWSK